MGLLDWLLGKKAEESIRERRERRETVREPEERVVPSDGAKVILLEDTAREIAEHVHDQLRRHPDGEMKGVLAALPQEGKLVGFKAIITLKSGGSSVTSPEEEREMFYELTRDHPDIKFILFHSHPDWIKHYSGGDRTNFINVYNGTDGYCDLQLLFHRSEGKGVTMKTYGVTSSDVRLVHDGMPVFRADNFRRSSFYDKVMRKRDAIARVARRHGFR